MWCDLSCSTAQGLCCHILCFIMDHTFSMGDGSGLHTGQSTTCTLLVGSHTVVTHAEYGSIEGSLCKMGL